ncbi:MAG: hypothetical protein WCI48_05465 [Bacteroidota bacterium]|jgi:hypothetical protein
MTIKKIIPLIIMISFFLFFDSTPVKAQNGPVNPMKEDAWIVNASFGAGTPFFGNGNGFGPAAKFSFEKGMWEVGPGTITLGAEVTFSYFGYKYGNNWHENWFNFIAGARSAYHYGWGVKGLDTYAGIPLGFGLCMNSHDAEGGYHTATPIYPYFGIFFGASYYFNRNIGVYGEFGYSSTYANMGIVFKLD